MTIKIVISLLGRIDIRRQRQKDNKIAFPAERDRNESTSNRDWI
jgi:hypothetical protein